MFTRLGDGVMVVGGYGVCSGDGKHVDKLFIDPSNHQSTEERV